MVRDDLDVLILRARECGDPVGDARMERGTSRLGKLTVRDVPDQDVLEGVLVLALDAGGRGRLDQVAALELTEILDEAVTRLVQVRDGTRPEDSAHDRGMLGDLLLTWRELVDAGFDQRLEAAWNGKRLDALEQAAAAEVSRADRSEHADGLFEEERIAARVAQQTLHRTCGQLRRAEKLRQKGLALSGGQGGEGESATLAAAVRDECGPCLHQLGATRAEHEDGSVRPVGDIADELEQGGLCPVQVLENKGERPAARHELEQAPDRPVQLRPADARARITRRRRRRADERPECHCQGSRLRLVRAQRIDDCGELHGHRGLLVAVQNAGDIPEHLVHWPVRDAVAI